MVVGIGRHEWPAGVSTRAADREAPALSTFFHARYGTQPGPRLETPAEKTDREQRDAQQRRQREEAARATQRQESTQQRQDAAITAVAGTLKVSRERAERVLAAVGDYFGLT